ncbi:unnamed protein product [Prorocentrum cordatum]|uniref:Uncharacterized protein n=1 Tax=Prorocentrum cordatum TaxID=2364126 RepID=A0ABN9T0M3_9DINO|nr:unnamed protein product [Polarella glacialis]
MVESNGTLAAEAPESMRTVYISPTLKSWLAEVLIECFTAPDAPTSLPSASTSLSASIVTRMPTEAPDEPFGTRVNLPALALNLEFQGDVRRQRQLFSRRFFE